jgi:hypothetical protein
VFTFLAPSSAVGSGPVSSTACYEIYSRRVASRFSPGDVCVASLSGDWR